MVLKRLRVFCTSVILVPPVDRMVDHILTQVRPQRWHEYQWKCSLTQRPEQLQKFRSQHPSRCWATLRGGDCTDESWEPVSPMQQTFPVTGCLYRWRIPQSRINFHAKTGKVKAVLGSISNDKNDSDDRKGVENKKPVISFPECF